MVVGKQGSLVHSSARVVTKWRIKRNINSTKYNLVIRHCRSTLKNFYGRYYISGPQESDAVVVSAGSSGDSTREGRIFTGNQQNDNVVAAGIVGLGLGVGGVLLTQAVLDADKGKRCKRDLDAMGRLLGLGGGDRDCYYPPGDGYHHRDPAYRPHRPNYRPVRPHRPAYHRPEPDYHRPRPDYHRPRPDYHRPRPDYHRPRPDYDRPSRPQHYRPSSSYR